MNKKNKEVFAEGICFKKAFWVFLIGCLFGTFWEMFYHYLRFGNLVSRSALIYGPLNPVYGAGAVIFMIFLSKYKNSFKIYIGGMILGGGVEYICSLVQEKIFGTISWNYSNRFLNFAGRTSLFYMLFWGLLALLFVKVVYPYLSMHIEAIPINVGNITTYILLIFIVLDIFISTIACIRENERYKGIEPKNKVDVFLDRHYPNERLDRIYANTKRKN